MTAQNLIDALLDQGVTCAVIDHTMVPGMVEDKLELDAPDGVFTMEVLELVKTHKAEMIHILKTMYRGQVTPPREYWLATESDGHDNTLQAARQSPPEVSHFDAGAAFIPGPHPFSDELPPDYMVDGKPLLLGDDGLWRRDGFIVYTVATRPAYLKYLARLDNSRQLAA